MFVLEVYIRGDRKEGTGKGNTQTHSGVLCGPGHSADAQGGGKVQLWPTLGAVAFTQPHTYKQSPYKKGDFSGYRKTKG